jgi:hypothetical protein
MDDSIQNSSYESPGDAGREKPRSVAHCATDRGSACSCAILGGAGYSFLIV